MLPDVINAAAITTVRYKNKDYAIIAGGSEGNTVRKDTITVIYDSLINNITVYTNTTGLAEARDTIIATTISVDGKDYAVFASGWVLGTTYSKFIDIATITGNASPTKIVS